jgi:hypothetical protein
MMKNNDTEDEMIRRNLTIALLSIAGLVRAPKTWTTPVIDAVILPAHAQMSCPSILQVDVIGKWLFTDQNGDTVEIEFVDDEHLIYRERTSTNPWLRSSDGALFLNIFPPTAQWEANITQEQDCIASEIIIIFAAEGGFTAPLIGARV